MADREKLIELLETVPHPQRLYPDLFVDMLIANGVTFAKDTNVLTNDVPDNNVGKWIPVTERLPEAEEYIYSVDVLFLDANGTVHVGYVNLVTGDWKTQEARWKIGKEKVTHWMPLPEPPKGE